VDEAMLLREGLAERHRQLDLSRVQPRDLDAERVHHGLAAKARRDAVAEMGVLRLEARHVSPTEAVMVLVLLRCLRPACKMRP
jgi:hypothetical protein